MTSTPPPADRFPVVGIVGAGQLARMMIQAAIPLGIEVRVLDYVSQAVSSGADASAATYIEAAIGDRILWGVGLHPSTATSHLRAVASAVNRAARHDPALGALLTAAAKSLARDEAERARS